MSDSELHYLTYDPDAIYETMVATYLENGGEVIYPGDEKDLLLRGVLAMFVQAFAGVDNALRMATLRYAVRDYLDIIGENRGCERITATTATAKATITTASGASGSIAAGTAVTADGALIWTTDEEITLSGTAEDVTVSITCAESGEKGNALKAGDAMKTVGTVEGVAKIVCAESASGGQDAEDDDTYRERIRIHGLTSGTTGTAEQYEAAAMDVSSIIIDANAVNGGDGVVNVYLLLSDESQAEAMIEAVEEALNDGSVRPLTDTVNVEEASAVEYTLIAACTVDTNVSESELEAAISEYQEWQDEKIGRAFNPDKLKALLYNAGAEKVEWGDGSNIAGGEVQYTEIGEGEHCKGTITLQVTEK